MKDRIIRFLKEFNLSSTKFADVIGVQRSSISHILSGRNKPSFDFIEKMLKSYPDLNAEWLLLGKGNMLKKQLGLFDNNLPPDNPNIQDKELNEEEISDYRILKKDKTDEIIKHNEKNVGIERIVIFYTDNSFKEYIPNNKNS